MPEVPELQLPESIKEFLEPISADAPCGKDATNEEEYFLLNMEIPKTIPDYKKCIELSSVILKEKSKDLKVAVWLSFALFRTEKIKGLRDGLSLILNYLINYGDKLFPSNLLHRSKAIQFLNSARFYKLLEKEEVNAANASLIGEAAQIMTEIVKESEKLFPGNVPDIKNFNEALKDHLESAKRFLVTPKQPEIAVTGQESKDAVSGGPVPVIKEAAVQKVQAATSTSEIRLTSEKDAVIQLRKTLLFFFEKTSEGTKNETIPESYFIFGLSRQLQWSKMFKPPDNDKITQIEAPNQIIQGKIKEWYSSNNWEILIPRIEINFLRADGEFPYWLDVQRYVTKALEQKGGNYIQASKEIKIQLATLLERIPELPQLKFKDKQTPFADEETKNWIEDEVKTVMGSSGGASILPPIIGEEYSQINSEYESACKQLPGNFEEYLSSMQKGIFSEERRKGKFLRRLNLANYCYQARQYNLAKINLYDLKELIEEYNLIEWEPALCTSVWESLYLTNARLIENENEGSSPDIVNEQKELFSKIAKYDGLIAIKLTATNNK